MLTSKEIESMLINSEAAVQFGIRATPMQLHQLNVLRTIWVNEGRGYQEEADKDKDNCYSLYNKAVKFFTKAQFCREAIEASSLKLE